MKKWKKWLAVLTAGTMCAVAMPLTQQVFPNVEMVASAEALTYGDFNYKVLEDGTISITDYSGDADTVEIPAEIDGDAVTRISNSAFWDCTSLTNITIPDSVTSIGERAFSGCISLTDITIPDSVTSIGGDAFSETPWLLAKQTENPLVIVNDILIDGATCVGEVVIPNSVTSIGGLAFFDCKSLTDITIPDSVTSIGESAFSACTSLTDITIPDSVTSIGEYAFSGCTSLTDVYYGGTEAQWNEVAIDDYNDALQTATIHFGNMPVTTTTTETTTTTTKTTTTTTETENPVSTTTTTTTSVIGSQTTADEELLYGDVNVDGKVNLVDAVMLNKAVSDTITLNERGRKNADCDVSGEINGNDALILLRFLVKLEDMLPVTQS